MKEFALFDLKKEEVGKIKIADKLVDTPLKAGLIKDVVNAHLAGLRQGTRATKNTSKVTASTRKLYRQKGTGRARAGSAKGVQRRHGATQFGPQPQKFFLKVNKKANQLAIASSIAELIRLNRFNVVSALELTEPKAKEFKSLLSIWQIKSLLVINDSKVSQKFKLATNNFKNIKLIDSTSLNPFDLFKYSNTWIEKDTLQHLNKRYDE